MGTHFKKLNERLYNLKNIYFHFIIFFIFFTGPSHKKNRRMKIYMKKINDHSCRCVLYIKKTKKGLFFFPFLELFVSVFLSIFFFIFFLLHDNREIEKCIFISENYQRYVYFDDHEKKTKKLSSPHHSCTPLVSLLIYFKKIIIDELQSIPLKKQCTI